MLLTRGSSLGSSPITSSRSYTEHIHPACPHAARVNNVHPHSKHRNGRLTSNVVRRRHEARAAQTGSTAGTGASTATSTAAANVRRRLVSCAAQIGSTAGTATSTANPQESKDYFQGDSRPIILYDGVCNLCNGAVNIMLDLDPEGEHFRMAALQSPAGRTLLQRCGRSPDDISSIVLVEPNYKGHIRSDAILKIAAGLSNPFPLLAFLGFPVPPFIRDAIYDQVANNRYSFFGQTDSCRLSNAGQEHRFVVE